MSDTETTKEEASDALLAQRLTNSEPATSKVGWLVAIGLLAGAAALFALFPWLEVNPSIQASLAMLSGLLTSFGDGSYSIPTLAPSYSIPLLVDLAQSFGQVDAWLQAFEAGSAYYSQAQEAARAIGTVTVAIYVIVSVWALSLVVLVVGLIRFYATREHKRALAVAGLSLLLALSGIWAIAYNVLLGAVDGADAVISGHALNAILCAVFCIAGLVVLGVSRCFGSKKKTGAVAGSALQAGGACPEEIMNESTGSPMVAPVPARKRSRVAVWAAVAGGALVVAAVIVIGVLFASDFFERGVAFDSNAEGTENTEVPGQSSAQGASEVTQEASEKVAATVDGAELAEQTVTDYVTDFRESSGLQDAAAWTAWLEENGYTPESVREEVIELYIGEYLLDLACEENGIAITDEELQNELVTTKAFFESEEAYDDALAESNMTEEVYVETVLVPNLKIRKLMEAVEGKSYADDEELNEAYQEWLETYRAGKQIAINEMPSELPYGV